MRGIWTSLILIALLAAAWQWRAHVATPPGAARDTAAAPARAAARDVAPAGTPDSHRGGAIRSVRGALATDARPRGGAAVSPEAAPMTADAADRATVAGANPPDARSAASGTVRAAASRGEDSAPARGTVATEAGAERRSGASNPMAAAAAPAAPAHPSVPAAVQADAPQPAAELFAPLIADDPKQVFAPATVNYHAAVQGEPVDPAWGPAASAALRGYIEGLFGARYEIPYVDCRQDLCELQIASRPGGDAASDMRDLMEALGHFRQQPWWADLGFDQEHGMTLTTADGRVIALWFLSRL